MALAAGSWGSYLTAVSINYTSVLLSWNPHPNPAVMDVYELYYRRVDSGEAIESWNISPAVSVLSHLMVVSVSYCSWSQVMIYYCQLLNLMV